MIEGLDTVDTDTQARRARVWLGVSYPGVAATNVSGRGPWYAWGGASAGNQLGARGTGGVRELDIGIGERNTRRVSTAPTLTQPWVAISSAGVLSTGLAWRHG